MSNSWDHETDPHNIVPTGFYCKKNKYTVTGFCSPAGMEVRLLMGRIRYDNGTETTWRYIYILRDFILETSHEDFVNSHEDFIGKGAFMNCPINEQTADGVPCGRCWHHLPDGHTCPRHGDVTAEVEHFLETGKTTLEENQKVKCQK